MKNLIPTIYDNERILTTEQLAQVYETDVNNIQANFKRNKERFEEGKHYYLLEGSKLKDFKNFLTDSRLVNPHTPKLYLWTERGADRHCKILDTDKAWEQFDHLEDTYFKVKENKINAEQLSPSLQMFKQIFDNAARQELENKQMKAKISAVEENVQSIKDVITLNPQAAWRRECNRILNAIGRNCGDYKIPKEQAYEALKVRGKCRPNVLVLNLKKRAKANGMAQSKIDKLNILDVLENEPRLKEIYVTIVKEIAIKNDIKVKEDAV